MGPLGTLASNAVDLLSAPRMQGRVTKIEDHRPWPMPRRPWVMAQTWMDLLFMHWPVPPEHLERFVPPQLPLDRFGGEVWISITPFEVRNLRPRLTIPASFVSHFPEINVRTYVTIGGKPGIYFFSLDARSSLAVEAARRVYRLPYFHASMEIEREDGEIEYASRRSDPEPATPPAEFRGRYRPAGAAFNAAPGSLDHWLTERYCHYTLDEDGRPLRGEIHHPPWPLRPAEVDIEINTMAAEVGLELDDDPLLHLAGRQDVVFWALKPA